MQIKSLLLTVAYLLLIFMSPPSMSSPADIFLAQARKEHAAGNIEAAVSLYKKTLKLDGKRLEARKELSELLINLHLNDPYAEDVSHFLSNESYVQNSNIPMLPGDFSLSYLSNVGPALANDKMIFNALLALTQVYHGDHESALKTAQALHRTHSSHPVPYNLIGLACQEAGSYAKARKFFQRAIELKEDFDAARINLAEVAIQQRKFSEAEALLKPLVDQKGQEKRRACLVMARLANARGNLEQEKSWLKKAMQDL